LVNVIDFGVCQEIVRKKGFNIPTQRAWIHVDGEQKWVCPKFYRAITFLGICDHDSWA
jgi:hypothetical protein